MEKGHEETKYKQTSAFIKFLRACFLRLAPQIVILPLAFSALPLHAQPSIPGHDIDFKKLFIEERWEEIIDAVETDKSEFSADLNYYYGTALARMGRLDEARRVFQIGLAQQPGDKRFPLELAGVYFKQKNYSAAAENLRQALKLDPSDSYANDFLASVYFLQGNLEAAIKNWNLISKPRIEDVRIEPEPGVKPALLDHAFSFAPGAILELKDWQSTEALVSGLNIFSNPRFDLEPLPDGNFDVVFRGSERNTASNWAWLVATLRGAPFETLTPEFYDIGDRAINSESLIRLDPQKRRYKTALSGPLYGNPKTLFRIDLDSRDENWELRRSFTASEPTLGSFNMRRQAFGASMTFIVNDRLDWSSGLEVSQRDFRNVNTADLRSGLLEKAYQLKYLGQINYKLLRSPEKRFVLKGNVSTQLGRVWSEQSNIFAKLQASMDARWFPKAKGDDYEMIGKLSAGQTLGELPFDELFILGLERDNDLLMRAHIGTYAGRKGSAPLGRDYLLSNWELNKNLYNAGFARFKIGPFLDSGKITDPGSVLGSQTWLWDLGAQAKVQALGVGIVFSYGKDLRSGNNAFYLRFMRSPE